MTKYRIIIAGVLSPFAGFGLLACIGFYAEHGNGRLLHFSAAIISCATVVVPTLPFLLTLALATKEWRRNTLSRLARIGLIVSLLSLFLPVRMAFPVIKMWKQSRNMAARNIPAPRFNALDLDGRPHRLGDHVGEVVLVNIWATWCGPCRNEMPKLDQLYRQHKHEGLVVFGMSDEDIAIQRKCLEQVPVTYPPLTYNGDVPSIYRDIAIYPTIFMIDRRGRIQNAMTGDQSSEELERVVADLLNAPE